MTARRGHRSSAAVLLLAFFVSECAAPPQGSRQGVHHLFFRSRDGVFLYRIPDGWFDTSAYPEAAGHALWLVSENLRATLAVEEVRTDDDVRQMLNEGALVEVGRLLAVLRAGKTGMVELRKPEPRNLEGREVCLYELANPRTHERHRVVIFSAAGRLYTATLIVTNGPESHFDDDEAAEQAQDLLVEGVRW